MIVPDRRISSWQHSEQSSGTKSPTLRMNSILDASTTETAKMTYRMPHEPDTDSRHPDGIDTGFGMCQQRLSMTSATVTPDSRDSCKVSIATRQAGPFASVDSRQTCGLLDVKYLSDGRREQRKV